MRHILTTILIFLSLSITVKASDSIEIIIPGKRVSVENDEITIIGKTDALIVDIYFNGDILDNVLVKDGFFHKRIKYRFGLHEVKLVPIYNGKTENINDFTTVEIMYAPMIEWKYKKLYPEYSYHTQDTLQICQDCHKSSSDELGKVDDIIACLDCHASLKENFNKHTKAESKVCIMCHDLSSTKRTKTAGDEVSNNSCQNCHKDKIKTFDKEYVHGPVAGGSCVICHAPHGSENEHNLNFPEDILCIGCHEDIEDQMNKLVVHKPFIDGNCAGCHDPHSTSNAWVLKKSSEVVCMSCHDKEKDLKDHKHPFNVKPKHKRTSKSGIELTETGQLECLSCHNPHSSKLPNMLKTTEGSFCEGCHTDKI